jgi:hypothetical protein
MTKTFKQSYSGDHILYQKEERVKLKKDMIIKYESMNGKQVIRCTRNMENIFKMQRTTRGMQYSMTNVADVHTIAVCSVHTVMSIVLAVDGELV